MLEMHQNMEKIKMTISTGQHEHKIEFNMNVYTELELKIEGKIGSLLEARSCMFRYAIETIMLRAISWEKKLMLKYISKALHSKYAIKNNS